MSAHAFEDPDHSVDAWVEKQETGAAAKSGLKALGSGVKTASAGAKMVHHLQTGETYDAVKDGLDASSGVMSALGHAGGRQGAHRVGSAMSAGSDAMATVRHLDQALESKDIDVESDEAVAALASFGDTVGDVSSARGAHLAAKAAQVFSGAVRTTNRGDHMAKTLGLHEDRNGKALSVTDDVANQANQLGDGVSARLGDGKAARALGLGAGTFSTIQQLPGAGLEAAGLGVAGYASDAWQAAKKFEHAHHDELAAVANSRALLFGGLF